MKETYLKKSKNELIMGLNKLNKLKSLLIKAYNSIHS